MAEQKDKKYSKRMTNVRGKVQPAKNYSVDDALKLVKETATAKFDESVDVAVNLGLNGGRLVVAKGVGQVGDLAAVGATSALGMFPTLDHASSFSTYRPGARSTSGMRTEYS